MAIKDKVVVGLNPATPATLVIAFQALQRTANFAISNPAREVLFTVVDRDEKYKPPPDMALASPDQVADAVVFALSRPAGIELREMVVATPTEPSWP